MRVRDLTLPEEVSNDPALLKDLEFELFGHAIIRLRIFPTYVTVAWYLGPFSDAMLVDFD